MVGHELAAVVNCVSSVCSAYHDGVELTQRIKAKRNDRKGVRTGLQVDESLQELELSLARGEDVIKSQYERDFRRFGESVASGDQVARDALKDINVHLQQQVVSNLKLHLQQDARMDFAALQDVSDSAQDRCTLILMQMQQRIVTSGPLENITPPPLNLASNHHQRPLPAAPPYESATSSFYKTASSVIAPIAQTGRGYSLSTHPANIGSSPPTPPHSPNLPLGAYVSKLPDSHNQGAQQSEVHSQSNPPPKGSRHKSAAQNLSIGSVAAARQALAKHHISSESARSQKIPSPPSISQYPPDNRSGQASPSPGDSPARAPFQGQDSSTGSVDISLIRSESRSTDNQYKPLATTTEKVNFFGLKKKTKVEKVPEVKSNPLIDQCLAEAKEKEGRAYAEAGSMRRDSITTTASLAQGPGQLDRLPWEREDDSVSVLTTTTTTSDHSQSPRPPDQARGSNDSLTRISASRSKPAKAHIEVLASNRPLASINPKDLLPNETNNYAGFCKGAWRQQIGDRKKAMEERVRPGSMYTSTKFWQCRQCKFEGRYVPSDNKKTPAYDRRIANVVDGIQFRWEFLFKSHVCAKEPVTDPAKGTYGCVFCCAEGKGTCVFEGVMGLMRHLDEHRDRLPTGEVLYRMNCLVGRQAAAEEDFDINIMSKEGGVF